MSGKIKLLTKIMQNSDKIGKISINDVVCGKSPMTID